MRKAFTIPSVIGLLAAGLLITAPAVAEPQADDIDPGDIDVDRIVRAHPNMPPRGAHMETVRSALGRPNETKRAVGDPPITRWIYDDFTVYFEHERVLHSVRPQRADD